MKTEDTSTDEASSPEHNMFSKIEIADVKIKRFPEKKECYEDFNIIDFDNSSPDCYGEEEWLIEELQHFKQEESKDVENLLVSGVKEEEKKQTKQKTGSRGKRGRISLSSSIMFEDRELPRAEMFICKLCHRVFGDQYKLDSHQYRMHNLKKIPKKRGRKPKVPKKKATWPPNVQELARRVNGVKTFFCNLCSYTVNRCDSMNKHLLRIHSNGRVIPEYQCEVCGKTFIDKAYLRNHGVSHVTERLHKCDVCGQAFHRQASLKRHRQGHSVNKQFTCILCEYQTNRKHLMYKHVDHHKTGRAFTCRICDCKFYTQFSFRSHLYTHKVTPNACSFCKVGFSSRERMICHMQKVHFACEIRDIKVG